jgi:mRNA-degrading endonuclease RelE of RelBE toxin-antitoxin system
MLTGTIVTALAVVEGKLCYYSYTMRDVRQTVQGLLLAERGALAGKRVYQDQWSRADRFVLEHVIGAQAREADGLDGFVRAGRRGDYVIVTERDGNESEIVLVRANRRHRLCRRAD